jgi:hypothetical protein
LKSSNKKRNSNQKKARTKKMPAPKEYIKNATSNLNHIIPHPQQRNNEAKQDAENRNPKTSVMILCWMLSSANQ